MTRLFSLVYVEYYTNHKRHHFVQQILILVLIVFDLLETIMEEHDVELTLVIESVWSREVMALGLFRF